MAERKTTTWVAVVAAVVLLVLLGAGYWLLRGAPDPVDRAAAKLPDRLSIFYTCDTRGHIEPCSCAEGMAGGVVRRTAFLEAQRAPARLLVDAGNVTAGGRDWERVEMRHILEAYGRMGYDAVNAGHSEATMDPEDLLEEARRFGRMVSANLLDDAGRPLLPPYRIAELPGGARVGIIGVMDDTLPADRLGPGLRIAPPEEAVARYLPEVRRQAPLVVLLAFAGEERMKALAERFYEIDVIVGGDVPQPSGTPVEANRSIITFITDKGKGVGRLDLALDPDGARVEGNAIAVLTEEAQADRDTIDLLDRYRKALSELAQDVGTPPHRHDDEEEGLTEITPSARSGHADTFAGAEACRDCHPQAYDAWADSAHARAFASLASRNGQSDPDCLPCHTVGYGATDGFVGPLITPHLKGVTCESCHGRGDHHVRLAQGRPVPVQRVFMKTVDCVDCHDSRNSPDFDLASYWEKIKHDLG